MPKNKIDITDKVMASIKAGEVKMKPKSFFVLGSVTGFIGLAAAAITGAFAVSLIRFSLRSHGPMKDYHLQLILSSFPWWIFVVGVIGIMAGVFLLKKYDFSYKRNFPLLVVAFVTAILISGWIIDAAGIDKYWMGSGPMRRLMQQREGIGFGNGSMCPQQKTGSCRHLPNK